MTMLIRLFFISDPLVKSQMKLCQFFNAAVFFFINRDAVFDFGQAPISLTKFVSILLRPNNVDRRV